MELVVAIFIKRLVSSPIKNNKSQMTSINRIDKIQKAPETEHTPSDNYLLPQISESGIESMQQVSQLIS
jgi:hypothetical protein